MIYSSDYRLERFIRDLRWETLPEETRLHARMCTLDLFNALILGTHSEQFRAGVRTVRMLFPEGAIPIPGAEGGFTLAGAASALGHASNAYDIDDGHRLIRAHPGTSFIGGVLAAAYELDVSYQAFLEALVAAYEVTIRMGEAMIEHYQYYHSSGSFGPVGIVTAYGKLAGWDVEMLNNALSIAEFNAPLIPAGRSVEYPSMNKDGVAFGAMIGALAIASARSGFRGSRHLMDGEDYKKYANDLGSKWEINELYFKPYAGCRWAHPAIDAVLSILREHSVTVDEIAHVTVRTFYQATRLSKIIPKNTDEAQYNIAFPLASAIVHGDFGYREARDEALDDGAVIAMMSRLSFEKDDELDALFPGRRCCRGEVLLKDGRLLTGPVMEPRGEPEEGIGFDWIEEKFRRMSSAHLTQPQLDAVVHAVRNAPERPFREVYAAIL